jgi:hypothetical protein
VASPYKKYPRTVKNLVDQDYAHALSPKDRAYLDQFNDEFYGASFTDTPLHHDVEQRRALYRIKNKRNADIYGRGLQRGGEPTESMLATAGDALVLTPEDAAYLNDTAYREALNEFRAALPTDERKKASNTREFVTARQKIRDLTGVETREKREGFQPTMSKKRIDRLKHTRQVLFNLGVTVANHSFTGAESEHAVEMLEWLKFSVEKLDSKLRSMGVEPTPPLATAAPTPTPPGGAGGK